MKDKTCQPETDDVPDPEVLGTPTDCFMWPVGRKVKVMWFGKKVSMKIIGHSGKTNQVQVQHLDAPGSFYVTPQELLTLNKIC